MKYRIVDESDIAPDEAVFKDAWEPTDRDLSLFDEFRATMFELCETALDAKFIELRDEALGEVGELEGHAIQALAEDALDLQLDAPLSGEEIDQFGQVLIKGYQKAMVADLVGPLVEATRRASLEINEPFVRLNQKLVPYETHHGIWLEKEIAHVAIRYDLEAERLESFAELFARHVIVDDGPSEFPGGVVVAQSPRWTFERPRYRATTEAKWLEAVAQKRKMESYGKVHEFFAAWIEQLRQAANAENKERIEINSSFEPVASDALPTPAMTEKVADVRAASSFILAGALDDAEENATFIPFEGIVLGHDADSDHYYVEFRKRNEPVSAGSIRDEFAETITRSDKLLRAMG